MIKIHKYQVEPKPCVFHIDCRKDAKLLKIGAQGNKLSMWYEEDTHQDIKCIDYIAYETGQQLDPELHDRVIYIDTVLFDNENYVLHIYRID